MSEPVLTQKGHHRFKMLIWVLSLAIPLVVGVLMIMPKQDGFKAFDPKVLPHLNAVINSLTSVCLLAGLYFIKRKDEDRHRMSMMSAFVLSSVFLISYVIYHTFVSSTAFGGEGWIRPFYYFVLISHILLAVVVVPLVLLALYYAFTRQIVKHKKIVKFTYPVWLYVAITGVAVYVLISPYYT
jgi:putative membrane protein